jgi:Ca2+-binding EF-hand superfamily protein
MMNDNDTSKILLPDFKQIVEVFEKLDANKRGKVLLSHFEACLIESMQSYGILKANSNRFSSDELSFQEEHILKLTRSMNQDQDGMISMREIKRIFYSASFIKEK